MKILARMSAAELVAERRGLGVQRQSVEDRIDRLTDKGGRFAQLLVKNQQLHLDAIDRRVKFIESELMKRATAGEMIAAVAVVRA